jgi:hypothetical protein
MSTLNKNYTSTGLTIALEAICARLTLSLSFSSLIVYSVYLSHGYNSTTAEADQEGLSP